jgi:murein DD-endopeptidase MepM/ murein hydrolase activator NlpD
MAPTGRGWRSALPLAVVVGSLSLGGGAAVAGGGGVEPPRAPKVSDVVCTATCGGVRKATSGSRVELSGRRLGHVTTVSFNAEVGGRIEADPIAVAGRFVKVRVPEGAVTGRPKVTDAYHFDTSPTELKIVDPGQIQFSGQFKLRNAQAKPRKSYFYGTKKPRVTYVFANSEPTDVRIDVVERPTGRVVDSWIERAQAPNTTHTASWSGVRRGKPVANGPYKFRVGPQSGTMDSTTNARFTYHRFKFPIRGRHSYGDGVGAPRSGHTHQGQDVMARCGTPLVAARGGRVEWKAYHSAAGYYLVIDGKKTGHDYVYMHLRRKSHLHRGQVVRTGQRIGVVGDSGNAAGCHLHFEEWSAPGWYAGGHFMRAVSKHLKKWDGWS